ncbi:UNVERIFIED_CONTAM: hypothetical protein FKN15_010094 [Acipenser sinensis]
METRLDWLSNQSFRTEDALTLHQRCTKGEEQAVQRSANPSLSVDQPPLEEPDEEGFPKPKKKKKDKKKKKLKRKHKKKSREQSESSRSGSDSDSPRGHASEASRLKQGTEKLRQEQIHLQGCFVWLDDLQTPTDQPFCVDKKADHANWEYKSLYRGDIARYRRKGNSCLGLNPKRHFITWVDSASEKKKTEKKQDRYFSKAGRLLLSTEGFPVHPGDVGPGAKQTPVTSDFMAVSDWKEEDVSGPAAPAWVNPLGVYDASTTLWLQGKGQPEPENQQARPAGATENVNTAMISKVEEFNRKLRENPEDAKTWMEFVNFQDELMTGPSPFTMSERESEKRKTSLKVTLEKKIAILERAIESNPGSVKLKLARLELCKELWEPSTLLKEWKKLVFLHPNNTELWKKYLLFCQSQFSTFSVLKVNSIYGKCLTTLAAVHDGSMVSHPALPGTEEAILEIFLRQCHFLRQAGHSEKVISLFQAVLDFTFFKPDSVKDLPTREQVLHYLQNKNKKKLKSQGKKSKKLAKNLLKEAENRNNLALWKEYAHLEWLLGNLEDSRKVFDTAITLATSQGLQNPALCSLCLLYTQLELEAMEDAVGGAAASRAVHVLTKLAECGPYSAYKGQVSPVNILKARKSYEYAFLGCLTESSLLCDSTVATMRADVAVSLVACFALFQYLTVGIEAADRVYMQALEKTSELFLHKKTEITNLRTQPTELETLTLMRALLLRYHMKVNVYPLGPLRETLTSALKLFPGNHSLWRLYVQTENKYHNASRARRFFDSVTRSAEMITPRLFAIYAEQKRKELVDSVQRVDIGRVYSTIPESGLSNRIRVLFEHAVQSDNGAHCPLLWRMYLHFLVSQGNRERSRGAFYKALQDCPWVKGLYMDAIEYFPDHMQEIMDLMTEKELRVRVPLEELDILLED